VRVAPGNRREHVLQGVPPRPPELAGVAVDHQSARNSVAASRPMRVIHPARLRYSPYSRIR
jgi:hypothetical protein